MKKRDLKNVAIAIASTAFAVVAVKKINEQKRFNLNVNRDENTKIYLIGKSLSNFSLAHFLISIAGVDPKNITIFENGENISESLFSYNEEFCKNLSELLKDLGYKKIYKKAQKIDFEKDSFEILEEDSLTSEDKKLLYKLFLKNTKLPIDSYFVLTDFLKTENYKNLKDLYNLKDNDDTYKFKDAIGENLSAKPDCTLDLDDLLKHFETYLRDLGVEFSHLGFLDISFSENAKKIILEDKFVEELMVHDNDFVAKSVGFENFSEGVASEIREIESSDENRIFFLKFNLKEEFFKKLSERNLPESFETQKRGLFIKLYDSMYIKILPEYIKTYENFSSDDFISLISEILGFEVSNLIEDFSIQRPGDFYVRKFRNKSYPNYIELFDRYRNAVDLDRKIAAAKEVSLEAFGIDHILINYPKSLSTVDILKKIKRG